MARIPTVEGEIPANLLPEIEKATGPSSRTRVLAHNPAIASAIASLVDSTDQGLALDPLVRQVVILVACRRCPYEFEQQAEFAKELGLDADALEAFEEEDWTHPVFTDPQKAAFRYAMLLEAGYGVADEDFEEVRNHFSAKEIVEISCVACTYGMRSRLAIALAFDAEGA